MTNLTNDRSEKMSIPANKYSSRYDLIRFYQIDH